MLEIRAGTGGDEAALFARDLYEMYRHYCEAKGWKVEVMDMNSTELGGFKEVILGLEGEGVYRAMQYENGGHRVQRVPETEAKGRVHTSAATVAVMPEPEDLEIDLKPADYVVERYARSSGPGGQHVNKTASAIRLTHAATGLEVCCQDEKSQHKNLSKALRVLKSRLYELKREAEMKKRSTRTPREDRFGRPQRTHPHLQFPAEPAHRPSHQPELQSRKRDCRQPRARSRRLDRVRPPGPAQSLWKYRLSSRLESKYDSSFGLSQHP